MIAASRRGFITGLVSFIAAPAIVRAGSLMPVKAMIEPSMMIIRTRLPPVSWRVLNDMIVFGNGSYWITDDGKAEYVEFESLTVQRGAEHFPPEQ